MCPRSSDADGGCCSPAKPSLCHEQPPPSTPGLQFTHGSLIRIDQDKETQHWFSGATSVFIMSIFIHLSVSMHPSVFMRICTCLSLPPPCEQLVGCCCVSVGEKALPKPKPVPGWRALQCFMPREGPRSFSRDSNNHIWCCPVNEWDATSVGEAVSHCCTQFVHCRSRPASGCQQWCRHETYQDLFLPASHSAWRIRRKGKGQSDHGLTGSSGITALPCERSEWLWV